MTRDLYKLNLLAKLMVLHRHILFNLAIAAIAGTILMQISTEQVPSLHRVAPRYLKLVLSSNFWPFHANICTDVVRAVLQHHQLDPQLTETGRLIFNL